MDIQSDAVLEMMAPCDPTGDDGAAAGGGTETVVAPAPIMKGYSKDIFQKGADKFLCVYCKNVLRNPVQCKSCGHRFCKCCGEEMKRLSDPAKPTLCPACLLEEDPDETILDLDQMFEDKAAVREMRKLETKCPSPKCTWTGKFQQYQEHETECEHRLVVCSQCLQEISLGELKKHQSDECPKRPVICNFCNQGMTLDELEKHKENCPNAPIQCDKCNAQVPRNQMTTHLEKECPHREIQCPVPECRAKLSHKSFMAHLIEAKNLSSHLSFLYSQVEELNSQLETVLREPEPQAAATGGASRVPALPHEGNASPAAEGYDGATGGAGADAAAASQGVTITPHGYAQEQEAKLKLHEDLMSVLHSEILRCIQQIEALAKELEDSKKNARDSSNRTQALTTRVEAMETRMETVMATASAATQATGTIINSHDGSAVWRIENFSQVKRAAANGEKNVFSSPSFYTHPMGYKMRLRIFPNGDGDARGNAISVFMQLQKGDLDELLVWPFAARVYIMILDQKDFKHHVMESFSTGPNLQAFKRPTTSENPASGCQKLVSLTRFGEKVTSLAVGDTVFIKVVVDFDASVQTRTASFDPKKMSSRR